MRPTTKIDQICPTCGQTFRGYMRQKFCSISCANKSRQPWNKGLEGVTYPSRRTGEVKQCDVCGKEFYAHKSRPDAHCCSPECYFKSRWPDNTEERTCPVCGKPFRVAKSAKKKTCSRECLSTHFTMMRQGERSHLWRGGYDRYYGSNWKRQRRFARKRDNYTCQRCGITEAEIGKQLDVHHIRRINDFERKTDANTLSNLVTLCHVCHMLTETEQGVR